jgi:dipeptidyl aminopeptidase/acylaminoacyl peptidase
VGEPIPVAEQVGVSSVGGSDFRASSNGVWSIPRAWPMPGNWWSSIARASCEGARSPPNGLIPELSPDERRVALRAIDPQARTRDLWLVDRTRGISSRFTFEKGEENYPQWSPDGKRIAYLAGTPGAEGITVKELTGFGRDHAPLSLEGGPGPQVLVA